MTKEELIKFLESFADDIQIIVRTEHHAYDSLKPIYLIYKDSKLNFDEDKKLRDLGLTDGDGFILV